MVSSAIKLVGPIETSLTVPKTTYSREPKIEKNNSQIEYFIFSVMLRGRAYESSAQSHKVASSAKFLSFMQTFLLDLKILTLID